MKYLSKQTIDDILYELRSGYMIFCTNLIEEKGYKKYQIIRYDLRQFQALQRDNIEHTGVRLSEQVVIERVASFKHELRVSELTHSDTAWHQLFMYTMRDITQRFLINYEIEPYKIGE